MVSAATEKKRRQNESEQLASILLVLRNEQARLKITDEDLVEELRRTAPLYIPVSVLADRTLGPLEASVVYLRDQHQLSFHQIAQMLSRDDLTIWATYHHAKRKVSEP